jgi:hypothetical protein
VTLRRAGQTATRGTLCAMLRQTIILTFLILSSTITAQEIFDIHFNFEHSLRLENYFVNIKAQRRGQDYSINLVTKDLIQNESGNDEEYKTTKDTTFEISKEVFQSLIGAVIKISCTDMAANMGNAGLDGTTCEIYYGDWASSISYKIWSPTNETKERKLTEFLGACNLILRTAGLKPNKIL